MAIFILSCGSDVALVVNNQTIITFDPQADDSGVLDAVENAALSLANMTNSDIERIDTEQPEDDWSWDEIIEAHLPPLQASTPILVAPVIPSTIPGKYRVTWSIDVDEADTPVDAAASAYQTMLRKGSIAVCFDVLDQQGNTTAVDLLEQDDVYIGLQAALALLDEDEDLSLWEVEVGLFPEDDGNTAIDIWTVYVAAHSSTLAESEAISLAKDSFSEHLSDDTSFDCTSCFCVNPEDFRDAVDGQ